MSALRAVRSARIAIRAPTVTLSRAYSPDVRPEGTTASSKGFSQREQAAEKEYILKREKETLKKAQDKLAEAKAEVEAQQKKVDEHK